MATAFPPRADLFPVSALPPATFKTKLAMFFDAVVALLGDDGETATARAALGAAESGANSTITSLAAVASMNTGQLAGLRNAVINGNGLVQQRSAPTLTAALQYGAADRHLIGVTGGTGVSGTAGVLANAGFSCGVGYGAIAASWTTGAFILKHRIEGDITKQFNGKTVTVSGKLYQNTGGSRNLTVSVGKPTTTLDTFSAVTTLGTSSAIAVTSGTVTPFSYTLALGSTDASLGLEVLITDNATNTVASKNYAVSDLQVEIGAVATVFEQRLAPLERMFCLRYYETVEMGLVITGASVVAQSGNYVVPKRSATPTLVRLGNGLAGASAPTTLTTTATGYYFERAAGNAGGLYSVTAEL